MKSRRPEGPGRKPCGAGRAECHGKVGPESGAAARCRGASRCGFHPIPARATPDYARLVPLLNVVLTLVVVGVVLWLINTYIPMQSTIKSILNVVVVIAVVLWLLYGFGVISGSGGVQMPRVK